jgi:predicted MFS family arabinose efflux permease
LLFYTDVQRSRWTIGAQVALAIGSVIPILGMPIIVGGLEDHWGYSATYAGYISSIDLAGLFVGSVTTSAWANRIDWRRYITAALLLCCALNVLCVWFHTPGYLSALRFAAGLTSGAAYSASLTLLSRAPDTARGFSFLIFAQVVANAAVLAVFPTIDASWGPGGLFVAIAVVMAVTLVVIPGLPGRPRRGDAAASPLPIIVRPPRTAAVTTLSALGLGAVALVYVAIGSYWAYAERMGIRFGLSATLVHHLLTASVLVSTLGCLAAYRVSRTLGQSRPLLAALGLLSVTLLVHSLYPTALMYVVTLGLVQVCWNFIDIFQLGTLAFVDPTGRAAALVPAAQGVALAIGPAAGGLALTVGQGYSAVLLLAGGAATLAALCYAIVHACHLRATPALRVGF